MLRICERSTSLFINVPKLSGNAKSGSSCYASSLCRGCVQVGMAPGTGTYVVELPFPKGITLTAITMLAYSSTCGECLPERVLAAHSLKVTLTYFTWRPTTTNRYLTFYQRRPLHSFNLSSVNPMSGRHHGAIPGDRQSAHLAHEKQSTPRTGEAFFILRQCMSTLIRRRFIHLLTQSA